VKTGDRWGAGTDANVKFQMFGKNGNSKETLLNNAQDNFERNKEDVFSVESVHLGELDKIRVTVDGSGLGSDWFLDKITVHSEKDNKDWFFLCGKWFDKKEGLSKEIPASTQDGVCSLPLVKYKISVTTGTILPFFFKNRDVFSRKILIGAR
jgi:hypothetical protein